MSIVGPSWLTFGGSIALAFALGGAGGFFKGLSHEKQAEAARVSKQTIDNAITSAKTARATFRLQEVRDADQIRINDRLADALQRLRNRPADRVPAAATLACAGATGAQLSGPDAGFLERLAARGDQLRADLATCRGWIEKVTEPIRR